MSGICGITGFEDRNLIKRMCEVMSHRGPDDSGIFSDKNVVLGHRRLSITEPMIGKQPIPNEDGSIWIVLDGEIYNRLELQEQLERKGHRFATASDAEVIIHSYEESGGWCAQKLKGDFSFAVWDSIKRKLILARDRVGVKPLFYTQIEGDLVFASEIKAILQYEKIVPRVNRQSLHYFLSLRFIPGEYTMFEGIKKLLPGHILTYQKGKIEIHKYWDLTVNTTPEKTEEYYIKNIQSLFKQAVERRLIRNIPVGVSLSGGIDSSSIVAVMSELVDEPIKTFSMGFGEPTDELDYAQLVADRFETEHHTMLIDLTEVGKLLPGIIWHTDDPFIDPQRYVLYRLATRNVKVMNNGGGGDELFGGYDIYKYLNKIVEPNKIHLRVLRTKMVSNLLSQLINAQLKIGALKGYEYRRRLQFLCSLNDRKKLYLLTRNALNVEDEKEKIYSREILSNDLKSVNEYFEPFFRANNNFLDQVLMAELKTKLPDKELLSEDRMSMAHSLETRAPFLDADFVDFAFTIPAHLKVKEGSRKYILKKAMTNILPDEILNRPKDGFAFEPTSLFESLKEYAEVFLSEENIRRRGYFNYEYIRRILKHKITPKLRWHYYFIIGLLGVELWHRIYIDQDDLFRPNLDINDLY